MITISQQRILAFFLRAAAALLCLEVVNGLVSGVDMPTVLVYEDRATTLVLTFNGTNSSAVSYSITSLPSNGRLFHLDNSGNRLDQVTLPLLPSSIPNKDGHVLYIPNHQFGAADGVTSPNDSFNYLPVDSSGTATQSGTVNILVRLEDDLPFAADGGFALKFDGFNDVLSIEVDGWWPTEKFTAALWFKADRRRANGTLLSFMSTSGRQFELYNPSNLTCVAAMMEKSSGVSINDGLWHHIAVMWEQSSGDCTIYVDYIQRAKVTVLPGFVMQNAGTLVLGGRQACNLSSEMESLRQQYDTFYSQNFTYSTPTGDRNVVLTDFQRQIVVDRAQAQSGPQAQVSHKGYPLSQNVPLNSRQVADYYLCDCAGGCFDPRFALSAVLEDFRLWSIIKQDWELREQARFQWSDPINCPPCTRSRPNRKATINLRLHLRMDEVDQNQESVLDYSGHNRNGKRGAGWSFRRPLRVPSSAPLLGGDQTVVTITSLSTNKLIQLPGFSEDNTTTLFWRINTLPAGSLFQTLDGISATGGALTTEKTVVTNSNGLMLYRPSAGFGDGTITEDTFVYEVLDQQFIDDNLINPADPPPVINATIRIRLEKVPVVVNYTANMFEDHTSLVSMFAADLDDLPFKVSVSSGTLNSSFVTIYEAQEMRCNEIPICSHPLYASPTSPSPAASVLLPSGQSMLLKDVGWPFQNPPVPSSTLEQTLPMCEWADLSIEAPETPPTLKCILTNHTGNATFISDAPVVPQIVNPLTGVLEVNVSYPYNQTVQVLTLCRHFLSGTVQCEASDSCTLGSVVSPTVDRLDIRGYVYNAVIKSDGNLVSFLIDNSVVVGAESMYAAAALGLSDMVDLLLNRTVSWNSDAITVAQRNGYSSIADVLRASLASGQQTGYTAVDDSLPRCFSRGRQLQFGQSIVLQSVDGKVVIDPASNYEGTPGSLTFSTSKASLGTVNSAQISLLVKPINDAPAVPNSITVTTQENTPVVMTLSSSDVDNSVIDLSFFVTSLPARGKLFQYDDSFGIDSPLCPFVNHAVGANESLYCTNWGHGIRSERTQEFSHSGTHLLLSQLQLPPMESIFPISLLNASGTNTSALGMHGGREDLESLPLIWDGDIKVGEIHGRSSFNFSQCGMNSSHTVNVTLNGDTKQLACPDFVSFHEFCNERGVNSALYQYSMHLIPRGLEIYSASFPLDTHMRVLGKAPPKRNHLRTSMFTENTFSVSSDTESLEGFGPSAFARSISTVRSQQVYAKEDTYVASDSTGGWFELWRGNASEVISERGTVSILLSQDGEEFETDIILVEVCGLGGKGPGATDGGNVLEGVSAVQLNGTKGATNKVSSPSQKIVYLPDPAYNGADSFTFKAVDPSGAESSGQATASITVTPVQTQVFASSIDVILPDGATKNVPVFGYDQDGLGIGIPTIVTPPSRGAVASVVGSNIVISVPQGSGGLPFDSFSYRVSDVSTGPASSVVTVNIHVWCRGGFFRSGFSCLPCPTGSYRPFMHDKTDCLQCKAGFSSVQPATVCTPCDPGFYAPVDGTPACIPCPKGNVTDSYASVACAPCRPGTYMPYIGRTVCRECGSLSYAVGEGNSECSDCPDLTRTDSPDSDSIDHCICEAGAYQKDLSRGLNCTACPFGGFCHGRTAPPVTKTGFWTDHVDWPDNFTAQYYLCDHRNFRGVCVGFPEVDEFERSMNCAHRSVEGICETYPEDKLQINIPTEVDKRYCIDGYEGRLCSRCAPGFYRAIGSSCTKCPAAGAFLPFVSFGVLIAGFLVILWAATSRWTALYIIVTWAQCFALMGQSGVPWPPAVARLLDMVSAVNFNLELAPLACINPNGGIKYSDLWFVSMALPIVVAGAWIARWLVPFFLALPRLNTGAHRTVAPSRPGTSGSRLPVSRPTTPGSGVHRPSRPSTANSSRSGLSGSSSRPGTARVAPSGRPMSSKRPQSAVSFADADLIMNSDDEDGGIDDMPDIDPAIIEDTDPSPASSRPQSASSKKSNMSRSSYQAKRLKARLEDLLEDAKGKTPGSALVTERSQASTAASSKGLKDWFGVSKDELRFMVDSAIWGGISVLSIMYIQSASVDLYAFACRRWHSKLSVLLNDPGITCWTDEHAALWGLATTFLPLHVGAVPAGTVLILFYGWKRKKLDHPHFLSRFGFLMERFERKYFWWELIVTFKKACFVLVICFLREQVYMQVFFLSIVLVANILANLVIRPYRIERHNVLETFLLIHLLSAITTAVGNPTDIILLTELEGKGEGWLSAIQVLMFLAVCIGCLYVMVLEVRNVQATVPYAVRLLGLLTIKPILAVSRWASRKVLEIQKNWELSKIQAKERRLMRIKGIAAMRAQGFKPEDPTKPYDPAEITEEFEEKSVQPVVGGATGPASVSTGAMLQKTGGGINEGDLTVREWDKGDVVKDDSWRKDRYSVRKRIFELERLLEQEVQYDSKSSRIVELERDLGTALRVSLQMLKREHSQLYGQLYDVEAEVDALEIEKERLERILRGNKEKLDDLDTENQLLDTRLELESKRLNAQNTWKDKLEEEVKIRERLEKELKEIYEKVQAIDTAY